MDAELIEHAETIWDIGQEILAARRLDRWPRNPGACIEYGGPCKFLGICSGYDSPDSEKWTRKAWTHAELPVCGGGTGRDILTNSRIKSFLTCRRRHYFDYELGIERVDVEERESLYFGTLMHHALEAWWKALPTAETSTNEQGVIDGIDTTTSPVTAAGTSAGIHLDLAFQY